MYPVPPDTKEKEKVIGGLLTWTQFFWLLGGAVLGIMLFIIAYVTLSSKIVSILLLLIGFGSSLPFVFFKKHDLTLSKYLYYKHILKKQTGTLINRRKDVE